MKPNRDIRKEKNKVIFKSGASRSADATRFDLVPVQFNRRVALRYDVGGVKHGDYNWLRGIREKKFILNMMNHIESHWYDFKRDGTFKDDNLGAMAWGLAGLMEVERLAHPILNEIIFEKKMIVGEISQEDYSVLYIPNKSPNVIEV